MAGEKAQAGVAQSMEQHEAERELHAAGGLAYEVLDAIERHMPDNPQLTAETGCGRSTIFFSNLSAHHVFFCLDDRESGEGSSVLYYQQSELFQADRTSWIEGPTQRTLKNYEHKGQYDCVLIDGPHGYPFPDMEYYFFYPHIKPGGLLIIDDVHIATIGRMADIIQEDAMWELVEVVKTTAIFRRTDAITFWNEGDGWWGQGFNQRRTYKSKEFYLEDGKQFQPFYERYFSHRIKPVQKKTKKKQKPAWKRLLRKIFKRR